MSSKNFGKIAFVSFIAVFLALSIGFVVAADYTLTVQKTGTGSGVVTSLTPYAGTINCGPVCGPINILSGQLITLRAAPSTGSKFDGWNFGICGIAETCTVTMNTAKLVKPSFTLTSYKLAVSKGTTGSGVITSNPTGIFCDAACSETTALFAPGTSVTLTASASKGSAFDKWVGDVCRIAGSTPTCTVTMDRTYKLASALFKTVADSPPVINTFKGNGGTKVTGTAYVTSGTYNVFFYAYIQDPDGDTMSFSLYDDATNPIPIIKDRVAGSSGSFSGDLWPDLNGAVHTVNYKPGTYKAMLIAKDSKGLESQPAFVDIVISAPPSITLAVNPATPAVSDKVTITAEAKYFDFTSGGRIEILKISNTLASTVKTCPSPALSTCAIEYSGVSALPEGHHIFLARIVDNTGKAVAEARQLDFDVQKPVGERVQTSLAGWWNLISLPGDFTGATSNCGTEDELWIYFWDAAAQNYVTPVKTFAGVKTNAADKIKGTETSFYIYSTNKCTLDFAGVTRTQGKGKIKLLKGWNFIPITKDMSGDTLDTLGANCDILAAYVFDGSNQQNPWQTVALGDILTDKYSGIVVWNDNTAGCTLGA